MKHHWVSALLCAFFVLGAIGCGKSRPAGERKGRWAASQTGSNLRRWVDDSPRSRQTREKQRSAKAKRQKAETKKARAEKPKRDRQERRRRATDDEVITRGGFR